MRKMTECVRIEQPSLDGFDSLSPAVHRASTIKFRNIDEYATRLDRILHGYAYGLYGTPTTKTLEMKISGLEDGKYTLLLPSGQAAISVAMLTLVRTGDHLLIPDSAYPPVKTLAFDQLAPSGVEVEVYDPRLDGRIASRIRPNTKLIWVESPGSTTMEIQDVPAIAAAAESRKVLVGCDNTWATPLLFRPLDAGADISMEALTKYAGGHSDVLMGSLTVTDEELYRSLKTTASNLGLGVSPEDCFLVLRGLETMAVRLQHVGATGERMARWIAGCDSVKAVLHPALEGAPGHAVWKRDFTGSSGVFSVVFPGALRAAVHSAFDGFELFTIGNSWGGTQSIAVPMDITRSHTTPVFTDDVHVRISIGLEDPEDLLDDLKGFMARIDQSKGAGGSAMTNAAVAAV